MVKYIDDPDFSIEDVIARQQELAERFLSKNSLIGTAIFVPRPVPPPIIYKYTSFENAKIILNSMSMRYTQSEVLDDIFEESPCRDDILKIMPEFEDGPTMVIDVMDPEDRLAMFARVRDAREKMRCEGVVLSPDIVFLTADGIQREWKYELGNRALKQTLENIQKPLALSLTELSNDDKMWSGYADSHRGVCLGFSTRVKYFRSNRDLIASSGYFAPIEYRDLRVEDFAYRFPYERFFLKKDDWRHQKEWRRIEFAPLSHDVDWSSAIFTFPFPGEALRSLTFGARCSQQNMISMISDVKAIKSLAHVKFLKTRASVGSLVVDEV